MSSDLTPMMKQYMDIKKKNPDAILFFRLGDFYEMFGDDAKTASRVLQIALTARSAGEGRLVKMPMCGVPFHAANSYILKLISNGYKVAICEQLEDPKAVKGLVKRDIVKIITPGTVLEEAALDRKANNYLISLFIQDNTAGIACVDASTGEFNVQQVDFEGNYDRVIDAVEKLQPVEVLVPETAKEGKDFSRNVTGRLMAGENRVFINYYSSWNFQRDIAADKIKDHFKVMSLESYGIGEKSEVISAAGALVAYLYETQKTVLHHINKISFLNPDNCLAMDSVSLRNLEITESAVKGGQYTLFSVLDFTGTAMGSRSLKKWLKQPLASVKEIKERQDMVGFFVDFPEIRDSISGLMKDISDMERIAGKLGSQNINGRDLIALRKTIEAADRLHGAIKDSGADILKNRFSFKNQKLTEVSDIISGAIVEEPPIGIKEGGVIKPGYNEELRKLKEISAGGKAWIAALQDKERKRTGISSLKVGYTGVFGYFIEVSKANQKNVPEDYIRKQTLVNGERFITPELKEYESTVLGAQEKIMTLEYEIFCDVRDRLVKNISAIQECSASIAELDCLVSLAAAAVSNGYVKPEITEGSVLEIEEGRHPVIEKNLGYNEFIPNDTSLDTVENMIMMITGPNMAGKSTYMRQVAVIVAMAQAGSYVPAKAARIGVVDKIFTRVGASDFLARGQSTFMVEMLETANILNNATKKSLILLDEVGRGTSTFDGVSIAWAITEYIHNKIGAKTLFATHYYELTEIADLLRGVKNYSVQVKEYGDKIVFLRKIIKGSTDRSYGIHVGSLAGLPQEVIMRAEVILKSLEDANYTKDGKPKIGAAAAEADKAGQLDLFGFVDDKLKQELKAIDVDSLTPVEALLKMKNLKDKFGL